MSEGIQFALDIFAVFVGKLHVSGWVLDALPIVRVELVSPGLSDGRQSMGSYGQIESSDVAEQFGPHATRVRFNEIYDFNASSENLQDVILSVFYTDGTTTNICNLVGRQQNLASNLTGEFSMLLAQREVGHLLEVGSRARSRIVRRDLVPEGWQYTGLDVIAGPNVDVVGDVHEVSNLLPAAHYDAVMAFSVLEHLLMPWKALIELNKVLKVGALGLFTTHQCWPIHDHPWDFWRFSDRAWDGLMNKITGFEVISAFMGEPAFIVAQRCHPVTNFGISQSGYLASNVLFRKIAETSLTWPVTLNDALSTSYPPGNIE